MTDVLGLLDRAEQSWRKIIKIEYPLFADTPVVKAKPDTKQKRHWMFYTDLTTTHMDVFKPDIVDKLFHDVIQKMYQQAYGEEEQYSEELVARLIHDNFLYLYHHEQFHPTFCPDSKNDEVAIDKALYEGILSSQPHLQKPDILRKVGNVRNAGWDQIIDGHFFALSTNGSSLEQRMSSVLDKQDFTPDYAHLPDGVVPIFDVCEFEMKEKGKKFDSFFYPLSRALYGLLFTKEKTMREILFDYFKDRITKEMQEKEFSAAMNAAVKGFIAELDNDQLRFARIDKQSYNTAVDVLCAQYNNDQGDQAHMDVMKAIDTVLIDKQTRYDAIRGFIKPLAKYISLTKEEKRHGTHIGSGAPSQPGQSGQNQAGGNTEQALVNLSSALGQQEGNNLLTAVANMPGQQGGEAQKDQRLIQLAKDEYYKRNAKEVPIRSPDYKAVSFELGKRIVPEYVGTTMLTAQELSQLNLEAILRFQEMTGITQLFQNSDHEWKYDHYEWKEIEDTDYKFKPQGLTLPDNIVFHNDSSGSMGTPAYVGTGCAYDILMHLDFGLLKTLLPAAKIMEKQINVVTANFSNGTIVSDAVDLQQMYDTPNNNAKTTLMGFQNGGTDYTAAAFANIQKKLKPGKTVHIFTTDGELNPGCQQATYEAIEKTLQQPDTSFLYFEIGTASSFGQRIKALEARYPHLKYYPNVTIQAIQNNALEVLLEYNTKRFSDLV